MKKGLLTCFFVVFYAVFIAHSAGFCQGTVVLKTQSDAGGHDNSSDGACSVSIQNVDYARWFPPPLNGWAETPVEVHRYADSVLQVQKKYRRLSDGAELDISVLGHSGSKGDMKEDPNLKTVWSRIGDTMGRENFTCQGHQGILVAGEGYAVLKFMLADSRLEINLLVNTAEKDIVKRYAAMLDLNRAKQLFLPEGE